MPPAITWRPQQATAIAVLSLLWFMNVCFLAHFESLDGGPPRFDVGPNFHIMSPSMHGSAARKREAEADPMKKRHVGVRELLEPGQVVVVLMAHNRPDALRRCIEALIGQGSGKNFSIAISLDDHHAANIMEAVARRYMHLLPLDVWRKPPPPEGQSTLTKISEHFRFALSEAFDVRKFPFAIFLEEDLLAAPDFLWYFRSTAWLLEEDPSLFCISAWNDNGFSGLVSNESQLLRTDFFPGLGWMVKKDTWEELRGAWPKDTWTGWDHWLRTASSMRHRECVFPEVPRTHHAATKGANVAGKFGEMLDSMVHSQLPEGQLSLASVAAMLKEPYEREFNATLRNSQHAASLQDIGELSASDTRILTYLSEEYKNIAQELGIFEEQPRTFRHGVIVTRHPESHARILLVERRWGAEYLPPDEAMYPRADRRLAHSAQGQSCDTLCGQNGPKWRCDARELYWVNNCDELLRQFSCNGGCAHGQGEDLPSYVHEPNKPDSFRCYASTEVKHPPLCGARHPDRARLCVCVPDHV